MSETLVRVCCDGPKPFTAGAIVREGQCVVAAPILRRHIMGKSAEEMRSLFKRFGWKATIVLPRPHPQEDKP